MNILITGGTGLIGSKLIKALDKRATITVLTRNLNKASTRLGQHIKMITALTPNDIENQDVVINLAGEPIADKRWSATQKNKICHSRWEITEDLAGLIKNAKVPPKLFISGSAIGIYGRQENAVIDEEFTKYHQEFTFDVCSSWEGIARGAESENTRVALLRTGIVLDEKSGALAKMLLPFKLGLGGKIGHGEQVMSWIHINDMVSAILHIMDNASLSGAINVTAEYPVTNEVFSKTLAQQLNRPCLFNTPPFLLKCIFGEMADLLLFGQHVVPRKLQQSGFVFSYPKIDAALKDLVHH